MSQIAVNDLTFSYDTVYDNIFEHVSFQIDTDWKLGFIGRNGRGKTTFLNLLLGKYDYQGSISTSIEFDYFPFEVTDDDKSSMEVMKEIIAPFQDWEREMELCLKAQENDRDVTLGLNRYGELQELYQKHDGYIIEELIDKEIAKLSMDPSVLHRPFSTLSFGERTKIMLGALFLKKNRFLLIDEPTNHLDMEGRETLAQYLQTKKGFILVSHDRAFLDQCIDHVLSINLNNIEVQKGNFSSWHENKELQERYELEQNEQLKKEIAILNDAAKRAMGWADQVEASKIGTHSADRGAIGHKAAKMMKRAKSIESRKLKAIDDKKDLLKNIEHADPLKMNVMKFHKKRFIEAEDLSLFYVEREVASNISFSLNSGERIAVRGKNGSGKSTLFKLLLGEDISYRGKLHLATGLKISYISQDTSCLAGSLKDFAITYGLDETIFKTVLRQLDFSRNQFEKDIKDFSGGQKKKVLLAKSLAEPAHVFLWDEPLNFIDVLSRVQIEELILNYQPTIVFVEHDKVFTDKIKTKEIRL
ncbi:ABC-F type ribosomal protection protein [Mobilitalea sibirica]|uniref:ABC-F type ribosomal protection protein n=1 Tax=Mobilitalea sibirica TaxID=1462919 RepID=A0A8J7KVV2_9FIRM|nr:ABC-F type ribosomal protection protein [Mobilitalea sibirica]MBH1940585.1 ABC-F type ribosomal protection protein [Mobilitalea sibirica]